MKAASLFILLLLMGCASDCDEEMRKAKKKYGPPEEVDRFSEENYHSETWWWWSIGFSRTFMWDTKSFDSCRTSDYAFDPIGGNYETEKYKAVWPRQDSEQHSP